MEAAATPTAHAHERPRYPAAIGPFEWVVCGIDGSPSAVEAARQASALVAPHGTIELVAVSNEGHIGIAGAGILTERDCQQALAAAKAELAIAPEHVVTTQIDGHPAASRLLDMAADADLVVVGRHGSSRLGGLMIGRTATAILHRADIPVLVAVQPPADLQFPGRILVAADGPDHPEEAVELAAVIAEGSGSDVTLLRVDWSRRAKRPELAEAVADLRARTGSRAEEIIVGGTPHRLIPRFAHDEQASLIVTGSRGLRGLPALRSVSERVAHASPCSVLVIHRPDGR